MSWKQAGGIDMGKEYRELFLRNFPDMSEDAREALVDMCCKKCADIVFRAVSSVVEAMQDGYEPILHDMRTHNKS